MTATLLAMFCLFPDWMNKLSTKRLKLINLTFIQIWPYSCLNEPVVNKGTQAYKSDIHIKSNHTLAWIVKMVKMGLLAAQTRAREWNVSVTWFLTWNWKKPQVPRLKFPSLETKCSCLNKKGSWEQYNMHIIQQKKKKKRPIVQEIGWKYQISHWDQQKQPPPQKKKKKNQNLWHPLSQTYTIN